MAARGQPAPLAFTIILAAVTVVGGLAVAKAPVLRQCLSAPLDLSACLRATPHPADTQAPAAGGWIDARANESADVAPARVELLPAPRLDVTQAFVPAVVAETPLNAPGRADMASPALAASVPPQPFDLAPTPIDTAAASVAPLAPVDVALAAPPALPVISAEPALSASEVQLIAPADASALATFGAVPQLPSTPPTTDIAAPPQTLLADASSIAPPAPQPRVPTPSLTVLPPLSEGGSPNLTLLGKPSTRTGNGSIVMLQLR